MIEQAAARHIDLDADCLLYGQLESIFWHPPRNYADFFSFSTLLEIPGEVKAGAVVLLITVIFLWAFYKELALSSFDPALSDSLGFSTSFLHYALMVFVAIAVVSSFSAVGSILVIAMIICPAATARLMTDRLRTQIFLSVLVASLATFLGYFLGAFAPVWSGFSNSVSAAGMITVVLGVLLILSCLFGPQYGVVSRWFLQLYISLHVAAEDILGLLYRVEEHSSDLSDSDFLEVLAQSGFSGKLRAQAILFALKFRGFVSGSLQEPALTEEGQVRARGMVRSHRLWEHYLVATAGLRPDHVHETASDLEHFTSETMQKELAKRLKHPREDPHGAKIPEET